ncbi:hypothetical protein ACN5PQ_002411 [Cronobacter turicensis]|uniref:hypothetical protein n=1 Tax=Cronobacter malonaticus TaxID=413503 RepID=UPI000CFD145C|nr:hypothetical protein [Cronobacter malonaticus]
MKYQALSILQPAVVLIIDGKKKQEIRSWLPPSLPLKNILLVQNENYLSSDDDEDEGLAMALVDFTEFSNWTEEEYLQQGLKNTLGRVWKPGYYTWKIENIRKLMKPIPCKAKKGIYEVELTDISVFTD